jgi:undecaprenyl pyrophosphate phosphatase UppP
MRRAILLGLLQGPTEMAPVSSSAHTALLQRLPAGSAPDPSFAKSFEIALHAGTAAALALQMGGRLRRSFQRTCADPSGHSAARPSTHSAAHPATRPPARAAEWVPARRLAARWAPARGLTARWVPARRLAARWAPARRLTARWVPARRLAVLGLTALPPALAGYLLQRPIERRGSGARPIALGLTGGALAMWAADRRDGRRGIEQAGAADALAIGTAQAIALMPGVSRRGATLTAARLRGFSRTDADELSWLAAVPVILGACTLKSVRLAGERALTRDQQAALLAGAGASFASTLLSARLQARLRLGEMPLAPFSVYRVLLALWMLAAWPDEGGMGKEG